MATVGEGTDARRLDHVRPPGTGVHSTQARWKRQPHLGGVYAFTTTSELRAEGLDRSPWIGRGLTGLIEFSAFQIPPGTRRGIVPDAASEAFARAMADYAPLVEAELARFERERQATTSRQMLAAVCQGGRPPGPRRARE